MSAIAEHPKVLVIDDEPDLRTLYEFSLVREGYVVHTADGVEQALDALRLGRYDAVITDMRLQDGLGLSSRRCTSGECRTAEAFSCSARVD